MAGRTNRRPRGNAGTTSASPAPEAAQEPVLSTPEQGAAIVGAFWDASAAVREQFPEKGSDRNEAYKAARASTVAALAALGLTLPTGLPAGKSTAMKAATGFFIAELAAAAAAPVAEEAVAA